LTAIVFTFAPWDEQDTWTFLPFFFMAQDRVPALERVCRVPFSAWIKQNFIEGTPGNSIDLRAVLKRIHWGREMFDLREVPYDRLNFRTEALNLLDEGIAATEVQQSFLYLSYPTKFLLSAYGDKKIRHGNNPVFNWMASCLQLQYDHKDNCQPSKPERMKSSKRIDGIQAAVTALSRALVSGPGQGSVYESRGLLTL
jgi:phage terminase large subunit-like protein